MPVSVLPLRNVVDVESRCIISGGILFHAGEGGRCWGMVVVTHECFIIRSCLMKTVVIDIFQGAFCLAGGVGLRGSMKRLGFIICIGLCLLHS